MGKHKAVAAPALAAKLVEIEVETPQVTPGNVLIRVEYASPTPLDVWQGRHGLLVDTWPIIPSDALSGTVSAVGEGVEHLKVGDKVFSFTFGGNEARGAQQYTLIPANRVGKTPDNIDHKVITTVPNNLVTAVHTLVDDLLLPLVLEDSDKPVDESVKNKRILVWGGSTSVGQYAIQLLAKSGYHHIITTASSRHHEYLRQLGATKTVDYQADTWKADVGGEVDLAIDCVGDMDESLGKIVQIIAKREGSRVAALLPLRLGGRKATGVAFEPKEGLIPKEVTYIGVRTHFYEKNERMKKSLQPHIIPALLKSKTILPNRARVVNEGSTLASYQKALDELAAGEVSGEKLVVQID